MSKSANDVVITGVGIVTSQGVGVEPHLAMLTAGTSPAARVETEKFSPYPVHPLPEIDWSQQIAKRDPALRQFRMGGGQGQCGLFGIVQTFGAGQRIDARQFRDRAHVATLAQFFELALGQIELAETL